MSGKYRSVCIVLFQVSSICQVRSGYFRNVHVRKGYAWLGQVRSCYFRLRQCKSFFDMLYFVRSV
jgi:hypothetical protein